MDEAFLTQLETAAQLPKITSQTYLDLANEAEERGHLLIARDLREEGERLKRDEQR